VRENSRGVDLVFSIDEHEVPATGSGAAAADAFPQLKIKDIHSNAGEHEPGI